MISTMSITIADRTMTLEESVDHAYRKNIKRGACCRSGVCLNGSLTGEMTRTYLSMGCVKLDDNAITWDSIAMERGL